MEVMGIWLLRVTMLKIFKPISKYEWLCGDQWQASSYHAISLHWQKQSNIEESFSMKLFVCKIKLNKDTYNIKYNILTEEVIFISEENLTVITINLSIVNSHFNSELKKIAEEIKYLLTSHQFKSTHIKSYLISFNQDLMYEEDTYLSSYRDSLHYIHNIINKWRGVIIGNFGRRTAVGRWYVHC